MNEIRRSILYDRLESAQQVCPSGSSWMHIKSQTIYEIITCAFQEADKRIVVVYGGGGLIWTREIHEFTAKFVDVTLTFCKNNEPNCTVPLSEELVSIIGF